MFELLSGNRGCIGCIGHVVLCFTSTVVQTMAVMNALADSGLTLFPGACRKSSCPCFGAASHYGVSSHCRER